MCVAHTAMLYGVAHVINVVLNQPTDPPTDQLLLASVGRPLSVSWVSRVVLKTQLIIGNCQRSVFSLGVSQHMHKITNL